MFFRDVEYVAEQNFILLGGKTPPVGRLEVPAIPKSTKTVKKFSGPDQPRQPCLTFTDIGDTQWRRSLQLVPREQKE